MSRKREPEVEKENNDRWLLTYSDLITLLMIFFVVLYSISKVDADKFQAVAESLSKALNGGTPAKVELSSKPSGATILQMGISAKNNSSSTTQNSLAANNSGQNKDNGASAQESMNIAQIKAKLDKFAVDNGLQTKIVSSIEERGLVISIQDTVLFPSGSANLTPYAQQILNRISVVLSTIPNYIRIEGHTDNVPIHTPQFQSNWELSVLRATNVLQILVTDGNVSPSRLSVAGYGEFRPITGNNSDAGRARNRRVDLVVLRSKYDVTEPGD